MIVCVLIQAAVEGNFANMRDESNCLCAEEVRVNVQLRINENNVRLREASTACVRAETRFAENSCNWMFFVVFQMQKNTDDLTKQIKPSKPRRATTKSSFGRFCSKQSGLQFLSFCDWKSKLVSSRKRNSEWKIYPFLRVCPRHPC